MEEVRGKRDKKQTNMNTECIHLAGKNKVVCGWKQDVLYSCTAGSVPYELKNLDSIVTDTGKAGDRWKSMV